MLDIPGTIQVILLLLGSGLLVLALTQRFSWLPESVWLIAGGMVLALFVEGFGLETGIRAHNFNELIFYVLLPVLIFEAAYSIPLRSLQKFLPTILTAATVGLVISALITGTLIWLGIGHSGFPLMVALLTGAVLAATDPVAVVDQLRRLGAPVELNVLMEGESLFNDATAIVLFSLLLSIIIASQTAAPGTIEVVLNFIKVFFGGILLGLIVGMGGTLLEKVLSGSYMSPLTTLMTAYLSFYLAEHWLHFSGVMAVFSAAMLMSHLHHSKPDTERDKILHDFWGSLNALFNIIVFVLMGLVIHISMFTERYWAMALAIPAALFGRTVAIYCSTLITRRVFRQQLPQHTEVVLVWGGLRGIVTVALALSLAYKIDQWFTVQSIAFGVVLFTLLVQAPTNPVLLRRLKII